MIGQIGPLVEGDRPQRRYMALHISGGLMGGALAGLLLGWLGQTLQLLVPTIAQGRLTILPAVLLATSVMDLSARRLSFLRGTRQTPGLWR